MYNEIPTSKRLRSTVVCHAIHVKYVKSADVVDQLITNSTWCASCKIRSMYLPRIIDRAHTCDRPITHTGFIASSRARSFGKCNIVSSCKFQRFLVPLRSYNSCLRLLPRLLYLFYNIVFQYSVPTRDLTYAVSLSFYYKWAIPLFLDFM